MAREELEDLGLRQAEARVGGALLPLRALRALVRVRARVTVTVTVNPNPNPNPYPYPNPNPNLGAQRGVDVEGVVVAKEDERAQQRAHRLVVELLLLDVLVHEREVRPQRARRLELPRHQRRVAPLR